MRCGTGGRSYLYLQALTGEHAGDGELVGVCDLNPGRLKRAAGFAADRGAATPAYGPDDFERMLRETGAERVIVTTPDFTHDDYIVRALEAGVDVVTREAADHRRGLLPPHLRRPRRRADGRCGWPSTTATRRPAPR